jgi:hypothetical protein
VFDIQAQSASVKGFGMNVLLASFLAFGRPHFPVVFLDFTSKKRRLLPKRREGRDSVGSLVDLGGAADINALEETDGAEVDTEEQFIGFEAAFLSILRMQIFKPSPVELTGFSLLFPSR